MNKMEETFDRLSNERWKEGDPWKCYDIGTPLVIEPTFDVPTMIKVETGKYEKLLHDGEQAREKINETINNHLLDFYRERERRIEYALRYLITPPVKGEITEGKLKWRGIYLKTTKSEVDYSEIMNGKVIVTEYYPILCVNQSRSGKRCAQYINLGIDAFFENDGV